MNATRPYLIGCGILRKEIRLIAERNGWDLDQTYLPSGLHIDFDRLQSALTNLLARHEGEQGIVFYGSCHPLMDCIIDRAGTVRTRGVNCVEIYLGEERFRQELEAGAFFLFEDWALHWLEIIGVAIPGHPDVMKSIFQSAHRYVLAIRTPCSGDFSAHASIVSDMTGLPLRWTDEGLEHLEATLAETLALMKSGPGR